MGDAKRIGLLVGDEASWPPAFIQAVERHEANVSAELVNLTQVTTDQPVPYDVIVDRMSHNVPFYRAYLKFAALQGCYVINNPFTWAADDKFFGMTLLTKLGFSVPRTALLPNKSVDSDATPESFRNLVYPLDWESIVEYVAVPAILKDAHTGGRRLAVRVHSVDELIDQYDQSGSLTLVLQEIIESDLHIHCLVVGGERTMQAVYDLHNGRYNEAEPSLEPHLANSITAASRRVTSIFGYDINLVECVIRDGVPIIINPSNPAPEVSLGLHSPRDFQWCVEAMASRAVEMAFSPVGPGLHTNWLKLIEQQLDC